MGAFIERIKICCYNMSSLWLFGVLLEFIEKSIKNLQSILFLDLMMLIAQVVSQ